MAKVEELFDNYNGLDMPESMLPDQRACSDILKSIPFDGYAIYQEALTKTIALFQTEEAADMYDTRNKFATTFNAFVIGIASRLHPEWVRQTPNKQVNRVYLEPVAGWRFYLKQLYGKQGRPDNVKTDNVNKINANELFEDEQPIMVVYVGAVMNSEEKYVIDKVVASHVNTKNCAVEWRLDMADYRKESTISFIAAAESEELLVTGKKRDDKELVKGKGDDIQTKEQAK